jgi:hypothetical protein
MTDTAGGDKMAVRDVPLAVETRFVQVMGSVPK